jgi:hypothetical protein
VLTHRNTQSLKTTSSSNKATCKLAPSGFITALRLRNGTVLDSFPHVQQQLV